MLLAFFGTEIGLGPLSERVGQPGRGHTESRPRAPSVVDHIKQKTEADWSPL